MSATALGLTDYLSLTQQLESLKSGPDRITQVQRTVTSGAPDLARIDTFVWDDGQTTGTLVSRSETSTDGLHSWQTTYGDNGLAVVYEVTNVYAGGGYRYSTNIAPDGSISLSTYKNARLLSVTRKDALSNPLSTLSYSYDAHGRRSTVADARNGATSYSYNAADLVQSVTTPPPGTGQPAQTTLTYYNRMLQTTNVIQPDGASTLTALSPAGLPQLVSGGRVYPAGYEYDPQGRLMRMTNWSAFPISGARVTAWNYDPYRGWLASKRYPDAGQGSLGPDYTYSAGARLASRTWARAVQTAYATNAAGEVQSVDYSDQTPDVTFTADRQGRQTQIVQGGATTVRMFDLSGNLLSERYTTGPLAGLMVTNQYDHLLRRTNLALLNGAGTVLAQTAFAYDSASRLLRVTASANTATYSYLANSPLVSQVFFTNGNAWRMTTSKSYDYLNRLLSISSSSSSSFSSSFSYVYNNANQRTLRREADSSSWRFDYDALGQVTSGKRYWPDWTPVAGQQFEYTFDTIGNRLSTKAGGAETGVSLRSATYSANLLNQYTSRTVPGAMDIMGVALATNTVTVNSQATYRKGEYFRKELTLDNSGVALFPAIPVHANDETDITGNVFIPKTPENFAYDADGNLTNDGRWNYYWDAENRLVAMTNIATVPDEAKMALTFGYDWQGRRIEKTVYTNYSGAYVPSYTNRFVYDGWNPIAVLGPQSAVLRSFTWGLDLSGSLQGAGGVGGLLFVSEFSNGQISASHMAAVEGNGNVVTLVDAASGSESARYEYGPFGELLRTTGPARGTNPFRFSTKYQDDESDLVYYGCRYERDGRWLSRDPVGEVGHSTLQGAAARGLCAKGTCDRSQSSHREGKEIYGFVSNDPVNKVDPKGEAIWWDCIVCAGAIGAKFQGTAAGCAFGCAEVSSSSYPYGQCLSECLSKSFSPCELWKSFKGNPAEWVGAAACISCGVTIIEDLIRKPPKCDDCQQVRWKPRVCYYICGDLTTGGGRAATRWETYPGEFDGGCPKMRYVGEDGIERDCTSFPAGPQEPGPTTPPPPRSRQ